jgi:deoxycytidine triphosphate deaminase/uncharacterized protein YoxC
LLSSAEVHDYARLTGMLSPFYPDHLKSASYEDHIGGQCIWWDENGQRQERNVVRGTRFVLRANSITFVQAEPIFRLPDYIAVRFNLRITHVHRGLLLGTGPLVDPGFEGKLLIPLHNLTSSDYEIDTNEALIWIEFTKTTFGCIPTESLAAGNRQQLFKGFPPNKKNMTADQYLRKANSTYPIRSSIPAAILESTALTRKSQDNAEAAEATAKKIQFRATLIGAITAAAFFATLIGLYFQVSGLVQTSNGLTTTVQQQVSSLAVDGKELATSTKANSDKIQTSQKELARIGAQIEDFSRSLSQLKQQVSSPAEIGGMAQQLERLRSELEALKQAMPRTAPK